jgi:signal transduction histidine kinase
VIEPPPEKQENPEDYGTTALVRSLDVSDEPVYIYDTQGRCKWVNRSGERLLGLDAQQIIGRYIFELFPSQSWFQIKAWRRVIDAKEASCFISQIALGANPHRFITSLCPVMDNQGRVQSVVSVGRPFVEKEALQYENQLRGAELALIHELSSIVTSSLDIGEVYGRFAAEFKKLVSFDCIVITLLDETRERVVPAFISPAGMWSPAIKDHLPVSQTGMRWAVQHQRTHVEHDLKEYREFQADEALAAMGIRSIMRVPLVTRNGVIGMMALESFQPNAFGDRTQAIAERVAAQIAPAIENARLYQESQEYAKELEVIDEVARIVTSSLRAEEVYERFASEIGRLVNFERIAITLVDEAAQSATAEYITYPNVYNVKPGDAWPLEGTGVGWVVRNRVSLIEADLAESRLFAADLPLLEAGFRSIIRTPFICKDRVIGVFALSSTEPRAFGPRERRILERLAAQIAPAIENARLYAEVEQTLEQLRSTQEQMVRVERLRAMGELASGVAHDFNNSLAAILGRTQLLMNQISHEPYLKSLQLIEKAAHDSAQVVRRILDFARFSSETDFSSVDVNRLVDDVVELTRHKWSDEAQTKGHVVEVRIIAGDVPLALGNYAELREVLMNVVINACEAIPGDGAIDISTDSTPEHVIISISDTGVGMSPEVKERIFDPFFTTKGLKGTGLGLSVALSIISRHNGTIDVDSEEGEGTTVRISLPISHLAEASPEAKASGAPRTARAVSILVVEDEPLIRETLADMLSLGGHRVMLASNGEEGIALFEKGKYDLVFTDLSMPGISGWDVVKAIKRHNSDIPVIMVTGWGVGIDQAEMDKYGVDEVLPKPFDIDNVLSLVNKLMGDDQ